MLVLDVLQVLLPEVVDGDPVRELVAEQRARRLRDEDLPAVSGRSSRSTFTLTKSSFMSSAVVVSSNDSRSITWHQ